MMYIKSHSHADATETKLNFDLTENEWGKG